MVGNCIIALVFHPLLAELFTFCIDYFRGNIRSDKYIKIGSLAIRPKIFRLVVFILTFIIFYPIARYFIMHDVDFGNENMGYLISYMCFVGVIEPIMIHLNGDKDAATPKNDPENLIFSMKGNIEYDKTA